MPIDTLLIDTAIVLIQFPHFIYSRPWIRFSVLDYKQTPGRIGFIREYFKLKCFDTLNWKLQLPQ